MNTIIRTTHKQAQRRNAIVAAMFVPAFNAQPKHDDRVGAFLEKIG